MQASTQVKQAQAEADAAKAQAAQVAAASASAIQTIPTQVQTAVAANKPKTDKIYYKGITITMGGFAEAASIYRDHERRPTSHPASPRFPLATTAPATPGKPASPLARAAIRSWRRAT